MRQPNVPRSTLVLILGLLLLGGCVLGDTWEDECEFGRCHCGDGRLDADEQCDDGERNSNTEPGACRVNCSLARCGDHVRDPGEACDEGFPPREACTDLGYTRGRLICRDDCTWDVTDCSRCGDGLAGGTDDRDPAWEPCDGADLRERTCEDLGHGSGTLACTAHCTFDVSGCADGTPICGNGFVEGDEPCDDGNGLDHDGCDGLCQLESARWEAVPAEDATEPPGLRDSGLAYDAARDRVVLFGGLPPRQAYGGSDELWEYDGTAWQEIPNISRPPWMSNHAMVYDAARGRTVLFGGDDGFTTFGDTWEWDGTAWTKVHPATSPPPRLFHAMAYDSGRNVVVLCGGTGFERHDGGTDVLHYRDTWEYDGVTWRETTPEASPGAPSRHAMAYDEARGRTVLLGGSTIGVWEYDGVTWEHHDPQPSPIESSGYVTGQTLVWHAARQTLVLYAQSQRYGSGTWEWDGTRWLLIETLGDLWVDQGHALVYDSARRRIVLFGERLFPPDVGIRTSLFSWAR